MASVTECQGLNPDIDAVNDQSGTSPFIEEVPKVADLQVQSNGEYDMAPIFDINGTCPMLSGRYKPCLSCFLAIPMIYFL